MEFKKNVKVPSSNQRGATIIEYALLASLVAVAAIAALTLLGTEISDTFTEITSQLS